jgi:rhamnose transport system permease protein
MVDNPLQISTSVKSVISRHRRELAVAAVYVLLLLMLAIRRPQFFHGQFRDGCIESTPNLVLAIGMTFVILARHIDISIGSQFSVCGVLAAVVAKSGLPMPLVAVVTLLIGGCLGAINGGLVAFLRLPSIVVTLATMVILRESLRWIREGEAVRDMPAHFQWFGLSQRGGEALLMLIALVALVVFAVGSKWLMAGRAVYAVGSDEEAARLAGLRPGRVVFGVFVVMGMLTGLASIMGAVRSPSVEVDSGAGLELTAIAAVVVGGTAIAGGRGTVIGTVIGVALLGVISPALLFLGVPRQWALAIQGAIILAAVTSDGFLQRAA